MCVHVCVSAVCAPDNARQDPCLHPLPPCLPAHSISTDMLFQNSPTTTAHPAAVCQKLRPVCSAATLPPGHPTSGMLLCISRISGTAAVRLLITASGAEMRPSRCCMMFVACLSASGGARWTARQPRVGCSTADSTTGASSLSAARKHGSLYSGELPCN